MKDVIFISFDIRKDEYPSMSYSIAALISSLKKGKITTAHHSFDLQHALEERKDKDGITEIVNTRIKENIEYFRKFRYIAISTTSWSIEYCRILLSLLNDYKGKIILGGYQVTAMTEESLEEEFPRADYYIKGYAEKALHKLLIENYDYMKKTIEERIEKSDLSSPYLTNVLTTNSKKIHWETKRGCPYSCGFCEWGNATKNLVFIDNDRLLSEIELFKSSSIDEINILDGTFNFGEDYLMIFKNLLEIDDVKITFQARFEQLFRDKGEEFIKLCIENKQRVHLEFGLQTIHSEEMETIGRKNDLKTIIKALELLRINAIDYEVSIIYAIPGQTVESFIDTIEFLITNGCKNIKAYPLSIPMNSLIERNKVSYGVHEDKNKYNVKSVISSYSFPVEQREDMDNIVKRLNEGDINTNYDLSYSGMQLPTYYTYRQVTPFQWEILSVEKDSVSIALYNRIIIDFISLTPGDIGKEDPLQGMIALGHSFGQNKDKAQFVCDIISGKFSFKLKNMDDRLASSSDDDLLTKEILSLINPNMQPKRYKCKVHLSRSGNIYVYRGIENL